MNNWSYRAAGRDGHLRKGIVEAETAEAAMELLHRDGLCCSSLVPGTQASRGTRSAPLNDLVAFFRGFATLLAVGLPLDRALDAASEGVQGGLQLLLRDARRRLHEGATLADALSEQPGTVPAAVLAVLAAGERSGRLSETLDNLAGSLERELALRAQLNHALAYPAVLAVTGFLSTGVILVLVIPKFAHMLADTGQGLPPVTAALLATGAWFATWWPAVLVMVVGALALADSWSRTPAGRRALHQALLAMPGVGAIRWRVGAARSLAALHAALASGLPLLPALSLARDACPDAILSERWRRVSSRVIEGGGLGRALASEAVLPPMAQRLVALGESSGQLGAMALRASTLLRDESDQRLETAVRLVEPALILAFGGLIGIVATALLQAVYSIRPVAS